MTRRMSNRQMVTSLNEPTAGKTRKCLSPLLIVIEVKYQRIGVCYILDYNRTGLSVFFLNQKRNESVSFGVRSQCKLTDSGLSTAIVIN